MANPNEEFRVLIARGLTNENTNTRFLELPDAVHGIQSNYLLSGTTLHEINLHKPRFASWFLDNHVIQDGSLFLATPVDILFLLLPALQKAQSAGNFCEIEHILDCVDASPEYTTSLAPLFERTSDTRNQLDCICDSKEVSGTRYYRLNEKKVIAWLKIKVNNTKEALSVPGGPFLSMDDLSLTTYAASLLGEYISSDWSAQLSSSLGLPSSDQIATTLGNTTESHIRKGPAGYNPDIVYHGDVVNGNEAKRPRFDPKEAARAKAAVAREEAKAAKKAKEAEGMRKLSSFFTKKSQ